VASVPSSEVATSDELAAVASTVPPVVFSSEPVFPQAASEAHITVASVRHKNLFFIFSPLKYHFIFLHNAEPSDIPIKQSLLTFRSIVETIITSVNAKGYNKSPQNYKHSILYRFRENYFHNFTGMILS
jgi:hypothetical protein